MNITKSIAVFGLGISNLSTIRAMVKRGHEVIAWDDNEAARDKAQSLGADIKPLNETLLKTCECLVLAPGVPLTHPKPHDVVNAATTAGIEIICDIELRMRLEYNCKTVGITGTNGKSTTTALIGHVLNAAGVITAVGGNIGTPIFDLKLPDENGVLVLELSSYQLDLCPTFRPDISLLTNITPDHIDRHGTIDNYAASKTRMFEGQGKAVIVSDDKFSQAIEKKISRTLLLLPHDLQEQKTLRGAHNVENMEAAFAVCEELGLTREQIIDGFKSFPGLEHRQFICRIINNIEFVNDSKATNAEASIKALSSYEKIFWIIGGLKKDGGLNGCEPYLNRVQKAYVIGEKSEDFVPYLEEHSVTFEICGDMETAVQKAYQDALAHVEHCTVLLSPATASFDQYKSFAKRGEHFETLVEAL